MSYPVHDGKQYYEGRPMKARILMGACSDCGANLTQENGLPERCDACQARADERAAKREARKAEREAEAAESPAEVSGPVTEKTPTKLSELGKNKS